MMKLKKFLATGIIATVMVTLVACGGSDDDIENPQQPAGGQENQITNEEETPFENDNADEDVSDPVIETDTMENDVTNDAINDDLEDANNNMAGVGTDGTGDETEVDDDVSQDTAN